jgi:hypothetical protein
MPFAQPPANREIDNLCEVKAGAGVFFPQSDAHLFAGRIHSKGSSLAL